MPGHAQLGQTTSPTLVVGENPQQMMALCVALTVFGYDAVWFIALEYRAPLQRKVRHNVPLLYTNAPMDSILHAIEWVQR